MVTKNRGHMSFDTFLQSLIKIGEFLFPGTDASTALQELVRGSMMPLHARIHEQQKFHLGYEGGVFELQYDELVSIVVKDIGPILHEIYIVHFPQEIKAVRGTQGGMPAEATWK